jgi:hypothetical protein
MKEVVITAAFKCSGRSPSVPPAAYRYVLHALYISVAVGVLSIVSLKSRCATSRKASGLYIGFLKIERRWLSRTWRYWSSLVVKTPGLSSRGDSNMLRGLPMLGVCFTSSQALLVHVPSLISLLLLMVLQMLVD